MHMPGLLEEISLNQASLVSSQMEPTTQMAHDQQQPKWEGEARAELIGPKAEQVWPLLEDFFGLHKWFPTLTTCLPVQGVSGQPGCVRYCAGFKTPVDHESNQPEHLNWTKQELLSIDPSQLTFSYSIVDGNVGFNSYISTVRVVPKEGGCSIEWKYEVEPVEGWTLKDLDVFIGTGLQVMASRMEASLSKLQV
ncbi:lachrymatory-factor synthase-like [Rosa rugosa]|uniref:lachrymatory-factor synthase-like n=1 Tax=Rosa rugosa TaxID=74645 RepID=UPI002B4055BE|nr:lachrymatory-factor synthase-like [Rosa rugosa]